MEIAVTAVNASSSPIGQMPYTRRLRAGAKITAADATTPDPSVNASSVLVIDSRFRPPLAWKAMKQKMAAMSSVIHHSCSRAPARAAVRARRERSLCGLAGGGGCTPNACGDSAGAVCTDTVSHRSSHRSQQASQQEREGRQQRCWQRAERGGDAHVHDARVDHRAAELTDSGLAL